MASFDQFRGRLIAPKPGSDELGISEHTFHRWIREGKIKAVKLSSRCTRIDGDSLADFLEARVFSPGEKQEQPKQLKAATAKRKASPLDLAGQA